eukprot:jgi/Hompol1/4555/HPOL_000111-RA
MAAIESTSVSIDDLKWVQEPSGSTEGPTFYVTTNPSVQITCRIYLPDGTKKLHNISNSGSSLKISEDKLSSSCGPMTVTYKHGATTPGPSYKVSYNALPALSIEIEMDAVVEAYQVNGGKHFFDPNTPSSGYISYRSVPKASVTGHFTIDGVMHDAVGYGVFSHVIQSPPYNVARWNYCNFQNANDALILYQFHTAKGKFPQDTVSQGCLVLNGKTVAVTINNHTVFEGTAVDSFSGYHIPKAVKHVWEGTANDGEPIKIEMRLALEQLLDKIDVLAELPFLIRTFIQTFITAPFVYQWIEDVTVTVTKGGVPTTLYGRLAKSAILLVHRPPDSRLLEQSARHASNGPEANDSQRIEPNTDGSKFMSELKAVPCS